MKQTLFEIRQRAKELLEQSVDIWRNSDSNEQLEDLEKDPVMSLIMTALAYQTNEIDNEIEHLKEQIIDDFAKVLLPYRASNASPVTIAIQTGLRDGVTQMTLDENTTFTLNNSSINFMPVLKTSVINAEVKSVIRIDARRWKVNLAFQYPVTDIAGLSFVIKHSGFRDLKITLNNHLVPIVKPWDFSDLPFNQCFGSETMLYNHSQMIDISHACFDLFARQDVRLFCIKDYNTKKTVPTEVDNMALIFEFSGLSDDFVFDKEQILLNCNILVNAELHSTTLSETSPIVRIADNGYFMHLVAPSSEQLSRNVPIEVRNVSADRFNKSELIKLLNCIVNKYYSDYYAFMDVKSLNNGTFIHHLQKTLTNMMHDSNLISQSLDGIYLMFKQKEIFRKKNVNLQVDYLITQGANINSNLTVNSTFLTASGFDPKLTRQIAPPILGSAAVTDISAQEALSKYLLVTNDKIITPNDIKLFCYKELDAIYNISSEMIKTIEVGHRQNRDSGFSGYEFIVEIVIADNPIVKRSFSDQLHLAELRLQKMIQVRSTNIYPIMVTISFETTN